MTSNSDKDKVIDLLKDVYDPEFPLVDVYTLGLVYDIDINSAEKQINIVMTLTTPNCPMPERIVDMVKNAISKEFENYEIMVDLVFEPRWTPENIKDEEIKQIFE